MFNRILASGVGIGAIGLGILYKSHEAKRHEEEEERYKRYREKRPVRQPVFFTGRPPTYIHPDRLLFDQLKRSREYGNSDIKKEK